jgi:putative DNA primase/helicase
MLTGSGGNGKGVLFRLLRAFLGGENVGSVGLRAMTSEGSHDPAELERKLANVDADVPSQRIGSDETETIKKLTGGDEVQVHRKYGQPFDLANRAKLTFAANEPPRFYGATDGIPRRLLSVEFPYRFTNDPDDGHKDAVPEDELLTDLTTDEELSGLLNRALAGLASVRDEHQFSIEQRGTARERFEEYMSDADSIAGFASGCLENRRGLAVPKDVVYSAYTAYCAANDHVPTDKGAFFRELGRKTDIETHTKQPRVDLGDSRQPRVLDHLWITDDALAYLSRPAREDCATLVDHMHPAQADYANDMLLRTDAPDDEPESGDPDTSQSSRRAAIGELVRDDGPVQRGEVANTLAERGFDGAQVMADMETMISEGDLIRGDDSMTVRWNG